ncbi:BrnT family toxin [Mesorhizobium sp. WSM4935]|uniref:BrnT family toxin n=1 Tax=Mesorhizobium sp. WSM4935 TaxID=3038547 RepID=UPI0024157141|nr:BrnT family toxin [Mesorhizobium sp. WSM4935]MDG4877589.1 BrnT family toxin [Mesorhizobium sp. WSM4935]
MEGLRFEWDLEKARFNLRKHGVSFETAIRVFSDPFALTEQDRVEGNEYRWQTIGVIEGILVLLVAHADREEDGFDVIRIISARRATTRERRRYAENRSV